MALTVEELIHEFRRQMDDLTSPYFWEDDDVIQFLDLAQTEFAERTEVLSEVATVTITAANDGLVTLPSYIYRIKRAVLDSNGAQLTVMNLNEVQQHLIEDDYGSLIANSWESQIGTPRILVTDYATDTARVVPKYNTTDPDDSMTLYYSYRPKKTLTASSSGTEMPERRYDLALIHYARALAYEDQDADTYDPKAADRQRSIFEERVKTFTARQKIGRRRAPIVRYGGY